VYIPDDAQVQRRSPTRFRSWGPRISDPMSLGERAGGGDDTQGTYIQ